MISPAEWLDIGMFLALIAALMAGFPVAFTLAGVALAFATLGVALGVFAPGFLGVLPQRVFGAVMTNASLTSVPLFVLMGVVLERSKIAEDLLSTAASLLAGVRGGLGFAVTLIGAVLAASTGVVGATVITMALIALPSMLKAGYSPRLASGSIAAAATLCQIIPPSVVLILLGDVIANANQEAHLLHHAGRDSVAVSDLFAGAIVPGMILVGLYLGYQALAAFFDPKSSPAAPRAERGTLTARAVTRAFVAPLLLIGAVLGSILGGLATPTEAAAVGAVGAIMLAALRGEGKGPLRALVVLGFLGLLLAFGLKLGFDIRLGGPGRGLAGLAALWAAFAAAGAAFAGVLAACLSLWRRGDLGPGLRSTAEIAAMVFVILIGASVFSIVFRGLGGDQSVAHLLAAAPGNLGGALIIVNLILFALGFFLDFIEITFVVVPVVAPALIAMGADPIWLGVLLAMNLQTSFLTPPFGFALFYLRGAAPDSLKTLDIYRGVVPFIGLQLIGLAIVWAFPSVATALPALLR